MKLSNPSLFRQQAFINGKWCDASDGAVEEVINPANADVIGTVPRLSTDQVEDAIAGARLAMADWAGQTAKERGQVLRRWADLMLENQEDLALIMTTEQGKPMTESRGEVAYAAGFLEWFAEEARRVYGETIPGHQADKRIMVMKQPIGVCAAITPWNFPAAMLTRKMGPALAVGCGMVAKPAMETPFTALALAVLGQEAGLPDGLFSIVTGDAEPIGKTLCESETVRKLSFTGSTEVGRILMRQSADTIKKLSLELGGNAAFIVFDDADVDKAVAGAIASKYRNTGQTCVCANRIFVQDGIYDEFAKKFVAEVGKLKVGNGTEEGVTQGPLITPAAVDKVERHIADARQKGATVLTGGSRHALGGTFFQPTVVGDATRDMAFFAEETFGPMAPLFRFGDDDEAIALANDTPFGLAAYFYARDLSRVFHVAEKLESGIVGVNTGLISTEVAPFGGIKQSGLGREGSHHGLDEYLEMKYVCIGLD